MIAIVCLDNNNGMMYNGRRQSRDRVVIERIKELAEGKSLWMDGYSAKLFGGGVCAAEDFAQRAGEGDYCFFETSAPDISAAQGLIIYRWMRDYPADMYFTADISGMELTETRELKGFSHECIIEESYRRKRAVDKK